MLAALLIHPGQIVSADTLIGELWRDEPSARAANLVSIYVLRLRRLMNDPDGHLLVTRAPGYLLRVAGDDTDADGSAPARVVGYTSYPHRTFRRGDSTVPEVKIAAEARTEFGKGAARRSRREGKVPAVLYGHGTDTRHLSLPGHALMLALKTPNVLLRLEGLKSGSDLALPKAVQRDPVRGFLEHVDLILVRSGEKVTIEVPIRVTGEIAPGEGMLNQQLVQIPVEADATKIPQGIDVDVEGMDIGDAVHASDLELPQGVTLQVEPDTLVLHVIAQQGGEPEEEEEAAEGAPEAPEALAETSDAGDRRSDEEQAG